MANVLDFAAVILPFLLSLLGIHMSTQLSKRKKWFLGACGALISCLVWFQQSSDRKAHAKELDAQTQQVEGLKGLMQANQVKNTADMSYLKAKLEDADKMNDRLAQFAPAIMKLAEVSAEFSKKEYENKTMSDHELYGFTMATVKKIRDFSNKYRVLGDQAFNEVVNVSRQPGLTAAQRQSVMIQEQQKMTDLTFQENAEFRDSILADAIFCHQELRKRKLPEPTLGGMEQQDVQMIFGSGALAGPYPELALADYLEVMAKPLAQR